MVLRTQKDWSAEELDLPASPSGGDFETMGHFSVVGGFASFSQTFDSELEHTEDHEHCPACKAANVALQAEKVNLSALTFAEARKLWALLRAQSPSLKQRTHETDAHYMNALEKFFGKIRLRDITPGHLRGYQLGRLHNRLRVAGAAVHPWARPAGHSMINHELSLLGRILRHCRLWARIKPYYFPLDIPKWSPRKILSEEDEELFFRTAAADPRCAYAYWVAVITNNTTASGCELRGLRLKHVFLRDPGEISEIYIPEDAVKNESRPRMIALNPSARWAVAQCYKRALQLGSHQPDHYLFPFWDRVGNCYIPERAPSRWVFRRPWEKLRRVTGFPELRPHDLRHHCITRMLENGVDPETITAIAGHRPNSKMLEYYAHQRKQVKYAAVMAIEPKRKKAGAPKMPPAAERPLSRPEQRTS